MSSSNKNQVGSRELSFSDLFTCVEYEKSDFITPAEKDFLSRNGFHLDPGCKYYRRSFRSMAFGKPFYILVDKKKNWKAVLIECEENSDNGVLLPTGKSQEFISTTLQKSLDGLVGHINRYLSSEEVK